MVTTLSAAALHRAARLKEQIEMLTAQFKSIIGHDHASTNSAGKKTTASSAIRGRRRKMSEQARAAQAKRMKKRWAKAKAAGKTTL